MKITATVLGQPDNAAPDVIVRDGGNYCHLHNARWRIRKTVGDDLNG